MIRCLLIFQLLCAGTFASEERPDIVFILADDLGIGDVNCYGGDHCQIETPNLDALAAGGLKFTDAHVNASVCIPTRMAIMTGKYPWRFNNVIQGGPWGFLGLRFEPNTFTLGDMFQAAGYTTGYVGKWHLGTEMATTDGKTQGPENTDFTKPLRIGPKEYGFDESFILPGSLDMFPYAFVRNNHWQGNVTAQKGWSAFNRVGPAEEHFEDHQVLETFYTEAENFIANQPTDAPFFLFLALTSPHTPTSPGVAWQGKSELGVYGDFVMETDHAVERVIRALKASNRYENTLILFSSDHGPASYAGNILKATKGQMETLRDEGHFANGPHRGYKFSIYEGGLRVPLIAHWPAQIHPGSECHELVGLCDLIATFAELTGASIQPTDAPDSISFANLLTEPESEGIRTNLVMQSVGPFAIRDGDWKLCVCPGSGTPPNWEEKPGPSEIWPRLLEEFPGTPTRADLEKPPFVQLFNLSEDLHEDHNLATENHERVASMVALLKEQIRSGRSTPGPDLENGRNDYPTIPRVPASLKQLWKQN